MQPALQKDSSPYPRQKRWLSLLEFAVGACIVIAHNVFHVLPNEVPILFVLGIISIRLREGGWSAIGLVRPKSWWRTALLAFVTAIVVLALGQFVTGPLAHALGLHEGESAAGSLGLKRGEIWSMFKTLGIVWTFAAFGEEISYHRYLLGRAADVGGRSALAYWIALLCASILWGFGHYYQGSAGMFETACDGFVIGAAYLLSKRNLWVAVLAHGFIDTIALLAVYTGIAN